MKTAIGSTQFKQQRYSEAAEALTDQAQELLWELKTAEIPDSERARLLAEIARAASAQLADLL